MTTEVKHPLVDGKILERLGKVRANENLSIAPSKFLRKVMHTPKGEIELKLRPYQVQMIYHLLLMTRFIIGDPTGTGKTLMALATFCYVWEKEPNLRLLIVTTKSSFRQWASEIHKFCEGVQPILVEGGPEARQKIYEDYFASWDGEKPKVLITTYARARLDKVELSRFLDAPGVEYAMLLDEVAAVKNPSSQLHAAMKELGRNAKRMYGITATLIKNRLDEGYGIYKVIHPHLFKTREDFLKDFCITKMQRVGGNRKLKVIVGHTTEHIYKFRQYIFPFYLGRAKHEIAKDLPTLTTRDVIVDLYQDQWDAYSDALMGLLTLPDVESEDGERLVETTKLTQLIYTQQIVNHPKLLELDHASAKLDALMDLLEEDFEGQKVIIFTRFRKMVDILQAHLESKGWSLGYTQKGKTCTLREDEVPGFVRVTGDEDSIQRDAAQRAFTQTDTTRIIFLTMAGSESLNLQQAAAMIFYDLPWSAGDFIQLLGRMIRIGSPMEKVVAVNLIAKGPQGQKTIDMHVSKTLDKKMNLIEQTLGGQLKNEQDQMITDKSSDANDLFKALLEDAKDNKRGKA